MAEAKTKVNDASVAGFLNTIADPGVREDCWTIVDIMMSAADAVPEMWGTNIVGFGRSLQTYANGRQAEWPLIGFSPRKQNISLYLMDGFSQYDELMAKLGKHSCGKVCLYIKRLSDVHLPTLKKLIRASVQHRLKTESS